MSNVFILLRGVLLNLEWKWNEKKQNRNCAWATAEF